MKHRTGDFRQMKLRLVLKINGQEIHIYIKELDEIRLENMEILGE